MNDSIQIAMKSFSFSIRPFFFLLFSQLYDFQWISKQIATCNAEFAEINISSCSHYVYLFSKFFFITRYSL